MGRSMAFHFLLKNDKDAYGSQWNFLLLVVMAFWTTFLSLNPTVIINLIKKKRKEDLQDIRNLFQHLPLVQEKEEEKEKDLLRSTILVMESIITRVK